MDGVRGIDVVVLVLLRQAESGERERAIPWLADELQASTKTPHDSLLRLKHLQLVRDREVIASRYLELSVHALQFIAPASAGPIERGSATAVSAAPLAHIFPPSEGELAFVWPDGLGSARGSAIEPLHRSVPDIARRRPKFHEEMALLDALRLRQPRIRREAQRLLEERLS